jgi:hypothetical protein
MGCLWGNLIIEVVAIVGVGEDFRTDDLTKWFEQSLIKIQIRKLKDC